MSAKVLIVEDEAPLAEMLRYNLEAEGFRVIARRDGEEALILVQEERPDLVLLDWMLPRRIGHRGVPAPAPPTSDRATCRSSC